MLSLLKVNRIRFLQHYHIALPPCVLKISELVKSRGVQLYIMDNIHCIQLNCIDCRIVLISFLRTEIELRSSKVKLEYRRDMVGYMQYKVAFIKKKSYVFHCFKVAQNLNQIDVQLFIKYTQITNICRRTGNWIVPDSCHRLSRE